MENILPRKDMYFITVENPTATQEAQDSLQAKTSRTPYLGATLHPADLFSSAFEQYHSTIVQFCTPKQTAMTIKWRNSTTMSKKSLKRWTRAFLLYMG